MARLEEFLTPPKSPAEVAQWQQRVSELLNRAIYGDPAALTGGNVTSQDIVAPLTIGDGGTTDYTEFEEDGTYRAYGDATAWIDLNFDVSAIGASSGAAAPNFGTFSGGTIRHAFFPNARLAAVSSSFEINHQVRLVTLSPHLHWVPDDTSTGDVKFSLTYTLTNGGDTEPSETTISLTDTADGTLEKNYSVAFPDIDASSLTPGAQFSFRLFRDPADVADTLASDVAVKTFGMHVEVQSLGTRTIILD